MQRFPQFILIAEAAAFTSTVWAIYSRVVKTIRYIGAITLSVILIL